MKKYGDTDFITGLRAYAAFAVLGAHVGGGSIQLLSDIFFRLVSIGGQGVAVFFVISGYSVSASYFSSKGFGDYINKRFWRIAPLYYFWILFAILFGTTSLSWQEKNQISIDTYNILMHITFLSSLDYRIAPTLLGVDWTLSIEMIWYCLIPSIVAWAKNSQKLFFLVMISVIIYIGSHVLFKSLSIQNPNAMYVLHWSPLPYSIGFIMGIVVFRLRQLSYNWSKWGNYCLLFSLLGFVALMCIPISIMHKSSYLFFTVVTFFLILFGSTSNVSYKLIFTNPIALAFGVFSYGIYLSHITVLEFFSRLNILTNPLETFFVTTLGTFFISAFLYWLIEKPFMKLGKIIPTFRVN